VYWGIDQAAVSFSYTFDLKKKGGKQWKNYRLTS
jgi:hypothetical protein